MVRDFACKVKQNQKSVWLRVTRNFWGVGRIDIQRNLYFWHQRCRMLLGIEIVRIKAPEERNIFYCKSQVNINLGVGIGPSELGSIAPLELIIILNNTIDILPCWGKIIVKIRQFSQPGMP
jgi:hypothetical protein